MLCQVIKEANQAEHSLVYILFQENYVFPSKIITNVYLTNSFDAAE